jgi:hypothetical protein
MDERAVRWTRPYGSVDEHTPHGGGAGSDRSHGRTRGGSSSGPLEPCETVIAWVATEKTVRGDCSLTHGGRAEGPVVSIADGTASCSILSGTIGVADIVCVGDAHVNGRVPNATEIVEERTLRRADDALVPQAVDELLLALLRAHEQTDLGRPHAGRAPRRTGAA